MVLPSLANDIRDIKPPVDFAINYFFLIIFVLLIALVGIFFLVRFLRKKILKKKVPISYPKSAHQIAYEALSALKAKDLPGQGKAKEYFFTLSDIARHYMENRFNIRAPEMTTDEFLFSLKDAACLSSAHKGLLKEFLTLSDFVKFAKYGPTQKEIDESFQAAIRLVDETKEFDQNFQKTEVK